MYKKLDIKIPMSHIRDHIILFMRSDNTILPRIPRPSKPCMIAIPEFADVMINYNTPTPVKFITRLVD